jgi:hypothetical protein
VAESPVNALNFTGQGDYAATDLDVQPDTMPSTTWEAWVNPARVDHSDWQSILSSDDGLWDRLIGIARAGRSFVVGTGTGPWQPAEADPGVWQHIAAVFTPQNIQFFKNGVESTYGAAPVGQSTMRALHLGKSPRYRQFFNGQLADVRIWNVARTAEQIRGSMNSRLSGQESGLAAYWPFADISGNASADATGNGNPALLVGARHVPSTLTLAEPQPEMMGAPAPDPGPSDDTLPVARTNGAYATSSAGDAASLATYLPDSGPYDNLAVDTTPTDTLPPQTPACTARAQTIFEIRKLRADAKQIGMSIMYEVQTMEKRKAYIEQMTAYLNDRVAELNKVKRDLAAEQKWIEVSNQRIAELAQKEKLVKLQDVLTCINSEKERLAGEYHTKVEAIKSMAGQQAVLENTIKAIRKKAAEIRNAAPATGS